MLLLAHVVGERAAAHRTAAHRTSLVSRGAGLPTVNTFFFSAGAEEGGGGGPADGGDGGGGCTCGGDSGDIHDTMLQRGADKLLVSGDKDGMQALEATLRRPPRTSPAVAGVRRHEV